MFNHLRIYQAKRLLLCDEDDRSIALRDSKVTVSESISNKLDALTSLRAFAAGAIVIFHMGGVGFLPIGTHPELANGVSFFFVLSGFILTYNYPSLKGRVGDYYLKRIARIWPLHLTTIALIVFLVPSYATWILRNPDAAIANVLLLQSWTADKAFTSSLNGVSWSISTEMFFYLLFPLLLVVRRFWIVVLAVAAITSAGLYWVEANIDRFDNIHPLVLHFPPLRLFEFVVGMWAAKIFRDRHSVGASTRSNLLRNGLLEVAAIGLVVASVVALGLIRPQLGAVGLKATALWLTQSGSVMVFAASIYVFAIGSGFVSRLLHARFLVLLGEISFATYMLHQIFIKYARVTDLESKFGELGVAVAIIFASYMGSYVLWVAIETPARRGIVALARAAKGRVTRDAPSPNEGPLPG